MSTINASLGEIVAAFYQDFVEKYGDEALAAVATDATLTELLVACQDDDG